MKMGFTLLTKELLRNKITHELMRRAVKEVCTRSDELISDMNQFIEQIKEQQ